MRCSKRYGLHESYLESQKQQQQQQELILEQKKKNELETYIQFLESKQNLLMNSYLRPNPEIDSSVSMLQAENVLQQQRLYQNTYNQLSAFNVNPALQNPNLLNSMSVLGQPQIASQIPLHLLPMDNRLQYANYSSLLAPPPPQQLQANTNGIILNNMNFQQPMASYLSSSSLPNVVTSSTSEQHQRVSDSARLLQR